MKPNSFAVWILSLGYAIATLTCIMGMIALGITNNIVITCLFMCIVFSIAVVSAILLLKKLKVHPKKQEEHNQHILREIENKKVANNAL